MKPKPVPAALYVIYMRMCRGMSAATMARKAPRRMPFTKKIGLRPAPQNMDGPGASPVRLGCANNDWRKQIMKIMWPHLPYDHRTWHHTGAVTYRVGVHVSVSLLAQTHPTVAISTSAARSTTTCARSRRLHLGTIPRTVLRHRPVLPHRRRKRGGIGRRCGSDRDGRDSQ